MKDKYGLSDRNRITTYEQLITYLDSLKELIKQNEKIVNSHNHYDILMNESSQLINKLAWDTDKARNFLYEKMNVTSRQKLGIEELKSFTILLKLELKE